MSMFVRKNLSILRRFGSDGQIKSFLSRFRQHKTNKKTLLFMNTSNYDSVSRRPFYNTSSDFEGYLKRNQSPDDEILQQYAVRDFLYPNLKDSLTEDLNNCKSIQDVLNFINNKAHQMKPEHVARSVLILWDFQKMFFDAYQVSVSQNVAIQDHLSHVLEHEDFKMLLTLVDKNIDHFNSEALSCMLMYLNKMGLSLQTEVLQKIIFKLQDSLKSDISLTSLSLFIVTASEESSLSACYLARDAFPFILQELEKCETVEDFKLITICLNGLRDLVTDDILDMYTGKVRSFLDKKLLDANNLRTIFKILTFLSYSHWNEKTTTLTSEVMLLLKGNLHHLSVNDLVIPYMVFCKNQEPGVLLSEFQSVAVQLWKEVHEDPNAPMNIKIKLLMYALYFTDLSNRSVFERIVTNYLKEPLDKTAIFDILKILLSIKSSKVPLYDEVWNKLIEEIRSEKSEEDENVLLNCCRKYVGFYNSTRFNNPVFEKQMTSWLSEIIENGTIGLIPSKLALVASFLLMFGSNQKLMVEWCVNKIVDNREQFNYVDCLTISRSWRNMEASKNPFVDSRTVHVAMDKCVSNILPNLKDSNEVVCLIKACAYRKRLFDKITINKLLLMLREAPILSSNSIRNVTSALSLTKALLPDTLDIISEYVVAHKENLLGFNAAKIVHLFYTLAYTPKNGDEFFKSIIDVVERDQERLSTYSYLQFSLALCFFKKLPEQYVRDIFNEEVLVKIEEELKDCTPMDPYPLRVRDYLMQLNRAVFFDYPELKLPWFHENYVKEIEKQVKKVPKIVTDVKPYLLQVLEKTNYILGNSGTYYGYTTEFILYSKNYDNDYIDSEKCLKYPTFSILWAPSKACTYNDEQLNGEFQMKIRHFESSHNKVIVLRSSHWNYLTTDEEKIDYLTNLLKQHNIESSDSSFCFAPS